MGWRAWIGDVVVATLLAGPFVVGPFVVAALFDDADRLPNLFVGIGIACVLALFVSAWQRRVSWHLLLAPSAVAISTALAASRVSRPAIDARLAKTLQAYIDFFHDRGNYWIGMAGVLALLFAFASILSAASARNGRRLRRSWRRTIALAIAIFGEGAIVLAERRLDDAHLAIAKTTWPILVLAPITLLAVFLAGGTEIEDDDDEARDRVLFTGIFAVAGLLAAAFLVAFPPLRDFSDAPLGLATVTKAPQNLVTGRTTLFLGMLLATPIALAALIALHPGAFWRRPGIRLPILAILAPLAVVFAVWMRGRRIAAEIAALDLVPPETSFVTMRAPGGPCDVDPDDIYWIGRERVYHGLANQSWAAALDTSDHCNAAVSDFGDIAFAVDETAQFGRVVCFLEAALRGRCSAKLVVSDGGHSRCITLKVLDRCSGSSEKLDVAMSERGIEAGRMTRYDVFLEVPRPVAVDALRAKAAEGARKDVQAATLHASRTTPMRDVAPVIGALGATTMVGGDPLAIELALPSDTYELVDPSALSAATPAEGLQRCREHLCSMDTWKKLDLAEALANARDRRDDAIRDAFLVLAVDPSALDGSGLDSSIVQAAKKLKQPSAVMTTESDAPPAAIADVVRANEGGIHRCVAELDLRRTVRADEWRFEVTIDARGLAARFWGYADISHGRAHDCLRDVFRAMRFPPPAQPTTIHYLLTLGGEWENDVGYRRGPRGHKTASLRMGQVKVTGALPAEIIQRIVRQNFGRFRLCYENGLRNNPTLQGRIVVRFTIDEDGNATSASDAGSDLPDTSTTECVRRGFENLSFPKPDKGKVPVVFPIVFNPGE